MNGNIHSIFSFLIRQLIDSSELGVKTQPTTHTRLPEPVPAVRCENLPACTQLQLYVRGLLPTYCFGWIGALGVVALLFGLAGTCGAVGVPFSESNVPLALTVAVVLPLASVVDQAPFALTVISDPSGFFIVHAPLAETTMWVPSGFFSSHAPLFATVSSPSDDEVEDSEELLSESDSPALPLALEELDEESALTVSPEDAEADTFTSPPLPTFTSAELPLPSLPEIFTFPSGPTDTFAPAEADADEEAEAEELADDEADEEEEESDDDPEEFTETHPLNASMPATAKDTKTGAFLEVIFIGSSFLCDC